MEIPVRCFTCGKVIGDKWEEYKKRIKEKKESPEKILDDLGLKRYCCRRMLLSHIDLMKEIMGFGRY